MLSEILPNSFSSEEDEFQDVSLGKKQFKIQKETRTNGTLLSALYSKQLTFRQQHCKKKIVNNMKSRKITVTWTRWRGRNYAMIDGEAFLLFFSFFLEKTNQRISILTANQKLGSSLKNVRCENKNSQL